MVGSWSAYIPNSIDDRCAIKRLGVYIGPLPKEIAELRTLVTQALTRDNGASSDEDKKDQKEWSMPGPSHREREP